MRGYTCFTSFILRVSHQCFLHGFRGNDLVLLFIGGWIDSDLSHMLQGLDHRDVSEFLGNGQRGLSGLWSRKIQLGGSGLGPSGQGLSILNSRC